MILRLERNVWRIEAARRAAVLIDAAAYFGAVRAALREARRTVFIVGWDIHSQTRLVGPSGRADDDFPVPFGEFLSELVRRRPGLEVCLLLWNYSLLYATERELFPTYSLRWNTPSRVRFCLDDGVPLGSSQHQKLIVVDDAIAFTGGLDVTVRRWDTSAHDLRNPHRVDNLGCPYAPFHDVQALVDGDAARALAEIVRARWTCAACDAVPPVQPCGDPWPRRVRPDFCDVAVGIARTQPPFDEQEEVREVEQLYLDSIDAAEHSIYIENQFLTCPKIAERLASRLRERPQLEAVLVAPRHSESWLEFQAMRNGRIRFAGVLREAGVHDRARLFYPRIERDGETTATMVHSKVMVVDDRLLRIGSANLNNRSMGTDTECDIVIEARSAHERRTIVDIRNRLLGDHCGVAAGEVAHAVAQHGCLRAAAEQMSGGGHRLQPIEHGALAPAELPGYLESVADPERPIGPDAFVRSMVGGRLRRKQVSTIAKVCLAAALVLLLAFAWKFTPLAGLAQPDLLRDTLATFARGPAAPFVVLAAFIAGGLLAFPVTILIAATAAAFGPLLGFAFATTGAMVSAVVTFVLGAWLGKDLVRDVLGPRLNRIRERIAEEGVLAVAAIRLVPLAPFTMVNLVAGASGIKPSHYIIGTLLGLAPGLIVMSALGHQIARVMTEPTPLDYALLVGAIMLWIATSIGVQVLVSKRWNSRP
jgi:phospholipase D1/2